MNRGIVVTGSSGFLGQALVRALAARGDVVTRLVRRSPGPDEASWDPDDDRIDESALRGRDAVVHLAGESIGGGRWSATRKDRIRSSRVSGTALLATRLAGVSSPPRVLVSASAVGFYGDRGDEIVDEGSPPGIGFLADVCRAWEAAADPAREAGVRVVHLRFGLVLSGDGGALRQMLPVFRLGLGGTLGSGDQWMSWVSIGDAVRILLRALDDERLLGPVNATAPDPVRNRDFTGALGSAVGRPTLLPVPRALLRWALGEMADEALLASTRAMPRVLSELGFDFRHPKLGAALGASLGQAPGGTRSSGRP